MRVQGEGAFFIKKPNICMNNQWTTSYKSNQVKQA